MRTSVFGEFFVRVLLLDTVYVSSDSTPNECCIGLQTGKLWYIIRRNPRKAVSPIAMTTSVVVRRRRRRSFITKWAALITQERFYVESPNFTYSHTGYNITSYFRSAVIAKKTVENAVSGDIGSNFSSIRQWFFRRSSNFMDTPDIRSLAAPWRLQLLHEMCVIWVQPTRNQTIQPRFDAISQLWHTYMLFMHIFSSRITRRFAWPYKLVGFLLIKTGRRQIRRRWLTGTMPTISQLFSFKQAISQYFHSMFRQIRMDLCLYSDR